MSRWLFWSRRGHQGRAFSAPTDSGSARQRGASAPSADASAAPSGDSRCSGCAGCCAAAAAGPCGSATRFSASVPTADSAVRWCTLRAGAAAERPRVGQQGRGEYVW